MPSRTPSFIVVGLVIIMFLLGFFYMSCSSKNTELRLSIEQFEERFRSLTIKNNDADKKIETLNTRKREVEEENERIRRQMEKKDSEVNDLNTKLNEKNAELRSLKSDKDVLQQQLKDSKSLDETIASKNSLIERLQQQLNEQKQFAANEQTRFQREIDSFRNRPPASNDQQDSFQVGNQRFKPLLSDISSTRPLPAFLQRSVDKLTNLTKEVKAQILPAAVETKDKILNVIGLDTKTVTNAIANQQEGDANYRQNPAANQNVPAPPLANGSQLQAANQDGSLNNPRYQVRQQRAFENNAAEKKTVKASNNKFDEEDDDEEDVENNVPANPLPSTTTTTIINENRFAVGNRPRGEREAFRSNNENRDRSFNRRKSRLSQRQSDPGEKLIDEENAQVQKRSHL